MDECEKGTRRSSRLPKNIFGGQVSVGGYASAGFAGAVKMPRAEAPAGFTILENEFIELKRRVDKIEGRSLS